ncbi:MAG: UxaA family hydrolase [Thaumarchaeota archaeon]|nr:UxaA family hydrolase [Nitrososphaerota archaeon]
MRQSSKKMREKRQISEPEAIVLNSKDNVATAIKAVLKGQTIIIQSVTGRESLNAMESIPAGHKIALTNISKNNPIIKFGEEIGAATKNIPQGTHVHTHNVRRPTSRST